MFVLYRIALTCVLAAGTQTQPDAPQQAVAVTRPISPQELRLQIRQAHTPEQYAALAAYFHKEATRLRRLAEEQEQDLQYAFTHPVGSSKYPSGADHARTFIAVYRSRSATAAHTAENYDLRTGQAQKLATPERAEDKVAMPLK